MLNATYNGTRSVRDCYACQLVLAIMLWIINAVLWLT